MQARIELWRDENGAAIRVERARGGRRLRGLIGASCPGPSEALLFTRCKRVHALGMAYPIDVVFLDRSLVVIGIETLRPWRFAGSAEAAHTLEMRAGECERIGVTVGDRFAVESPTNQEVNACVVGS